MKKCSCIGYFAQFFTLSTGYIEGTIPPVFSAEAKKPIPACGSDGVYKLDGRGSLYTMARQAAEVCKRRGHIGYTIERGDFLKSSTVKPLTLI
jgi:hypothetical protein